MRFGGFTDDEIDLLAYALDEIPEPHAETLRRLNLELAAEIARRSEARRTAAMSPALLARFVRTREVSPAGPQQTRDAIDRLADPLGLRTEWHDRDGTLALTGTAAQHEAFLAAARRKRDEAATAVAVPGATSWWVGIVRELER